MMKFLVKQQKIVVLEREVLASDQIAFVSVKFVFDGAWKTLHKVVQFTQCEETYNVVLGIDGTTCLLPAELHPGAVKMSLFGYDAESDITVRATTVPVTLHIRSSGFVADGDTPIPPTPDLYTQLLKKLSEMQTGANGKDGRSAYEIATENGFVGTAADLLRVWVDHGRNVENDVYGYVVYAGEGLPPQENPFDILRNDTLVQAVQSADEKVLEAVFYRADETVQWSGLPVKTSVPCVLLIERIGEEYSVSVTDPTMNVHLKQVKVEIGDVAIDITLPSGKECGKCVTQRFSPAVEKRRASALNSLIPDKKELDSRMQWFEQARFGMFIHWGVYSSLGCSWNGKKYGGYGEHIQRMARIPVEVYKEKVAGTFNPQEFDAEEWVRIAKETGMGYFIITSKHHDGFAMYDSKVSDYNIVKATPFGRDPMKDLRDACRKAGIKFGFYYSHAFD